VTTRVGLVVNAWDEGLSAPSGTGRQARLLAQELTERGVDVQVLVLEAGNVDIDHTQDDEGTSVRRVVLRRPSYRAAHRSVGAARTLDLWLRGGRHDVIHLVHPGDVGPGAAAWIADSGVPVVSSVCDALLGCAMGHLVNPLVHRPICVLPITVDECAACMSVGSGVSGDRFVGLQRERRALAEASVTGGILIADSAFMGRQIRNMFHCDIRVIGLPVVADVGPNAERTEPGPLRIGFFGLPLWRKGIDLLLDSVDGLEGVELHIHGPRDAPTEASYSHTVRERADRMGNVIWHPAYDAADVGRRMADVDVVAVPSRAESLPGVAKEALAAGRPVLAANVAGLPEVVIDGVTGWLVSTEQGWRAAISQLVRDPAATRAMRPQLSRPVPAYVDELLGVYAEAQEAWPARQAAAPWRAGLTEAARIRRTDPYLRADEIFQEAVWALTHGRRGAAAVGFARSATPAAFDRLLQTPAWLGGLALGPKWASRHAVLIQSTAAAYPGRRGALRAVVRGLLPQR
jgi:glycosyltransferase involved in cell wall biosynthesis